MAHTDTHVQSVAYPVVGYTVYFGSDHELDQECIDGLMISRIDHEAFSFHYYTNYYTNFLEYLIHFRKPRHF